MLMQLTNTADQILGLVNKTYTSLNQHQRRNNISFVLLAAQPPNLQTKILSLASAMALPAWFKYEYIQNGSHVVNIKP